jgi:uncharacterized protein (DUF302 family)
MADFGMKKMVTGSMGDVKSRLTEALKTQGFGILNEIDMQKTLKEKIGQDIEPYLILGICNPNLANQALSEDRALGLLLPCKAVLREFGSDVEVSLLDPQAMFSIVESDEPDNPTLTALATDAKQRLEAALLAI